MTRLIFTLAATTAMAVGFAALPAPAEAQQQSIAEIVVYGTDPCPRSTDDQVVVCARRPETERYRIPEKYRPGGSRQQTEAWANKAKVIETVGATGINSCSPVGPSGFTGCMKQLIDENKAANREAQAGDTPPED